MRIGLITDTHIPDIAPGVPPGVHEVFRGVDLILHAGDIYQLSVLDDLERIAPVRAALGDDDPYDHLKDDRVKMKHVLDLDGHTVWLLHERPLIHRFPVPREGHGPDVIVHGHSHDARVFDHDGALVVGSGSPTFLHYKRGAGTVALLETTSAGVKATIVNL